MPGYEKFYEEIKGEGVDEVYCLSVNDAFVMYQWGKHQGAEKIKLLPDGNGEFTRKMGMLVKKEELGFRDRSWRYSMVVNNEDITKIFMELGFSDNNPTNPFKDSHADKM